jgi:outer membrane protein assembly factor BamB
MVYVVTYHGKVAAVDLNQLRVLWVQDQSSYKGLATNPQVVVVSDEHDIVTAFDRLTGEIRWKQDSLKGYKISSPAIYEQYVVVGDEDGYVTVLDIHTGQSLGTKRITHSRLRNPPLVDNHGVIFQSQSGRLVKLNITPKRSK